MIDANISQDEFTLMIKEQKHFRLEERIRTKDDQLGDTEREKIIEHGKKIGQIKRKSHY